MSFFTYHTDERAPYPHAHAHNVHDPEREHISRLLAAARIVADKEGFRSAMIPAIKSKSQNMVWEGPYVMSSTVDHTVEPPVRRYFLGMSDTGAPFSNRDGSVPAFVDENDIEYVQSLYPVTAWESRAKGER